MVFVKMSYSLHGNCEGWDAVPYTLVIRLYEGFQEREKKATIGEVNDQDTKLVI